MSESQVKIAAKLYEFRASMRQLFGSAYREKMEMLATDIRKRAELAGSTEIVAATEWAKEAGGFGAVAILAAYVEMTEPSVAPDAAKVTP